MLLKLFNKTLIRGEFISINEPINKANSESTKSMFLSVSAELERMLWAKRIPL